MSKKITIRLRSVEYKGDSVGEDISVYVKVGDKDIPFEKRIRHGTIVPAHKEVGTFETDALVFEAPVTIKITEKDALWSDKGSVESTIKLDTNQSKQKEFSFEVKVRESWRFFFRRNTAVFVVNLEVRVENSSKYYTMADMRQYNSPAGKDYNRLDGEIIQAVNYWQDVFATRTNSPAFPLDPNLVKAMVFVESYVGQGEIKKGYYPPSPDVMQVADPANQAIHVFHNDEKMPPEYEVVNSKEEQLIIPEANGGSSAESIKWGVRWLYHKAQINVNDDGKWHTDWRSWKEVVRRYNGDGDEYYVDKVYKVYEQGVDPRTNYKLWAIALLLLASISMWGISRQQYINHEGEKVTKSASSKVAGDSIVSEATSADEKTPTSFENAQPFSGYEGGLKLSWENFPSTNCIASGDEWKVREILGNCAYTVGTNWKPYWTAQLSNGAYGFTPPVVGINYDSETDGPYAISIQHIIQGDLTKDNIPDAVVVMRVSYGGVGHVLNMITLVRNSDGRFDQVANYMFDDREDIIGLFINNDTITAHAWVKAYDDPQCCPTVYQTLQFKITN